MSTASNQVIITKYAQMYGVSPAVALTIAQEESGGTNAAPGLDSNGVYSTGLFQLNQKGQGAGYNPQALVNPSLNASIGVKALAPAYKQAQARGLSGYPLVQYVASHAGHPDNTGYLPASYNSRLYAAYQTVSAGKFGQGSGSASNAPAPPQGVTTTGTTTASGGGSNTSGSASSSNSLSLNPLSGIGTTLTKLFWGVAGLAVGVFGIWIMVNPEADLTSAIFSLGKGAKK